MKKKYFSLLLLLFSVCSIANAEETIKLDKTVIKSNANIPNYTLIPKEQKNTYVITQEKIREKSYKNVEDVLKDAPGVIIQNTAFGPRVDMRGSGEKALARVKVLVDGISINPTEETMASLPINAIPIETVKKIEIIPGGGATLYGSGSVGGVISITTNSNATRNNFFMDLNYGSYDNRNFGFAGGYNLTDKLYVNYGFNYLNSEGYRKEEEKENKIYLLGFDYKINDKNRFRFQTRKSDMKHDSSTELKKEELEIDRTKPGLNMDLKTEDESYTFDYEYRPTENLTLAATAYKQQQNRNIKAESVDDIEIVLEWSVGTSNDIFKFPKVVSLMDAKFKETKDGIKLRGKYDYSRGEVILGYDYQKSINKRNGEVKSKTLTHYYNGRGTTPLDSQEQKPILNKIDIKLKKESHGFYAFNKLNVTDRLDLTTGARLEMTEYEGYRKNGPNVMPMADPKENYIATNRKLNNFAGEIGGLYKYSDTGRFFTRYERGFVTPFANQLTDKVRDIDLTSSNPGYSGNPQSNAASKYVANNLKAEITDTIEIGFRDYIGNSLISTSFFVTDTKDEITFIGSGVSNPAVNRWKYRNIGKTRRMGIEFEAEQRLGNLTFNQSLTFLNTKVLEANEEAKIYKGDRVPLVPRLKASIGIKYDLTERLSLIADYVYLGKRETRELIEDKNDPNYNDKIIKHNIKGYGTLDVGVLYKADKYSNIKMGARNILNKKYNLRETSLEALPASDRNYYLELNVRF